MKFLGAFFIFCLTISGWASSYSVAFGDLLKELRQLKPESYAEKIIGLKKKVNDLIDMRRRVCLGEFSSDVFDLKNIQGRKQEVKKLTREQQQKCLIGIQRNLLSYYRALYQQRKQFFIYSHNEQMKKLDSDYSALLNGIEKEINRLEKQQKRRHH